MRRTKAASLLALRLRRQKRETMLVVACDSFGADCRCAQSCKWRPSSRASNLRALQALQTTAKQSSGDYSSAHWLCKQLLRGLRVTEGRPLFSLFWRRIEFQFICNLKSARIASLRNSIQEQFSSEFQVRLAFAVLPATNEARKPTAKAN